MNLFLDTHILIWLYQRDGSKFSAKNRETLDISNLYMPVISFLEIQFLKEIKRITFSADELLDELRIDLPINITEANAITLIRKAVEFNWTRDPFDRLIIAETVLYNAKLLTKDSNILSNFHDAVWF
jgi:PIN domain nuclease of toxin-antitoxin system